MLKYECHVLPYMHCGIELRAEEKIGKFGFTSLGIVEVVLDEICINWVGHVYL